jgi:hypothetical protein
MAIIAFDEIFAQLDQLLSHFEDVWRPKPFTDSDLAWQVQHPNLHQALLLLSDEKVQSFDDETLLLQWISNYLPPLRSVLSMSVAKFGGRQIEMKKFADVGLPGRKKQQIIGFTSALDHVAGLKDKPIVDWCSGKGYLARHLHYVSSKKVTCLEFDAKLCESGAKDVKKLALEIDFIEQDVLQPLPQGIVDKGVINTALHACGDLHVSMMRTATAARCSHIALSPCCYHLSSNEVYQKLSKLAQQSSLVLNNSDLRLAVLQTVTAGDRVKRLREQELIWRIGFDLLRRQKSKNSVYQPTPSINKKWLSGKFENYCEHVATTQQITLPPAFCTESILLQARMKYQQVIRLEKARLAFRKPLELWLLLDRVLFMQDQGYKVELVQFCEEKVSPRNALIIASLKG